MDSIFTLSGRVAIVTGGTRGIGKVIAIQLAKAGVKVAIIGRNAEKAAEVESAIKSFNGCSITVLGDIADEKECKRIAGTVYAEFGQIDILVNCAGGLTATKIEDITREEWDNILGVNLSGTFFMIQSVLPYIEKSFAGRIINISSNAGRMGGYANSQSYTASKGGVIAITKGIARQLAPRNVRAQLKQKCLRHMMKKQEKDLLGEFRLADSESLKIQRRQFAFLQAKKLGLSRVRY